MLYMLDAVEQTAAQTIETTHAIKEALFDYKHRIRSAQRFHNLFTHHYRRIEFIERDLEVSRLTPPRNTWMHSQRMASS